MTDDSSADPAIWFCEGKDGEIGPFTIGKLRKLARTKRLKPRHRVRKQSESRWVLARDVPRLFARRKPPQSESRAIADDRLIDGNEAASPSSAESERNGSTPVSAVPPQQPGGYRELVVPTEFVDFAMADEAQLLAIRSADHWLGLIDLGSGELIHRWNFGNRFTPLSGIRAALHSAKSLVREVDFRAEAAKGCKICISPAGTRVIVSLPERHGWSGKKTISRVLLADAANPEQLSEVVSLDGNVENMTFGDSENSVWIACSTKQDVVLQHWQLVPQALQSEIRVDIPRGFENVHATGRHVAFSENANLSAIVILRNSGWHAALWNLQSGEQQCELKTPADANPKLAIPGPLVALHFSKSGERLLTASGRNNNYQKQGYGMMGGMIAGPVGGLIGSAKEAVASAYANALQTSGTSLRSWDTATGELCSEIGNVMEHSPNSIVSATVSPCGKLAVSAGFGNDVHCWDLESEAHIAQLYTMSNSMRVDAIVRRSCFIGFEKDEERAFVETMDAIESRSLISRVDFNHDGRHVLIGMGRDDRLLIVPMRE